MNLYALPYSATEILASALAVAAAIGVWKRRSRPGGLVATIALASCAWWCFWHGISLEVPTLQGKIAIAWLWYAGVASSAWCLFVFSLQYARPGARWRWQFMVAAAIVPVVTCLFVWTNAWHHLYWTRTFLDTTSAPFPLLGSDRGPAGILLSTVNQGVILLAAINLLWFGLSTRGIYRRQLLLVVVGIALPLAANILFFAGRTPYKNLDFTPLTLTVGVTLWSWAIFGERLLDIMPIAQQTIVDGLSDAVFLVDQEGRVAYLNRAAQALTMAGKSVLGQPLATVLPELSRLAADWTTSLSQRRELTLGQEPRRFDVAVVQLADNGRSRGQALVLHDISNRGRADLLQHSNQHIIAAAEKVRREIADMLQSTVQAKLRAASSELSGYQSRWSTSDVEVRELGAIRDQIERVAERDVDEASAVLNPGLLSLLPAIEDLRRTFETFFEVEVLTTPELKLEDSQTSGRLAPSVSLLAFRVVEEGLSNAAKHAHASRVVVQLSLDDEALRVTVQDDGAGFDPAALQAGLGLTSIGGRVNSYRGAWHLAPSPVRGTTLSVDIPVAATPRKAP